MRTGLLVRPRPAPSACVRALAERLVSICAWCVASASLGGCEAFLGVDSLKDRRPVVGDEVQSEAPDAEDDELVEAAEPSASDQGAAQASGVADGGAALTPEVSAIPDGGAVPAPEASAIAKGVETLDASQNVAPADGGADAGSQSAEAGYGVPEAGAGAAKQSCKLSGSGLTDCGAQHESCCESPTVTGGSFYRTYENSGAGLTGEADQATVTTFALDKYLVTVGRFRQFVNAWNAGWVPAEGSGKHSHLNSGMGLNSTGGGYEPGWVTSDNNMYVVPTDANLSCSAGFLNANTSAGSYYTWTPSAGSHENMPLTCANWYEAYAFCIWDGAFLPSEAELAYAAAGGDLQLEYPWGTADPGTSTLYANYGCWYPNASGKCSGFENIAPVGTAAQGVGRYGQLDLAGTVWEWTLDWYGDYASPCVDCVNLVAATARATRGGDFNATAKDFPPDRHGDPPDDKGAYAYGFRCARSP